MSPRAAWRLEQLGFEAYDYTGGKADWLAAGLPTEGTAERPRRALEGADTDVATCGLDDAMSSLPNRSTVVVNDGGVVLGRVSDPAAHDPAATAAEVMASGPTTVRADEPLDDLLARMAVKDVGEVLVTTPEGVLLGAVRRPRVEPR